MPDLQYPRLSTASIERNANNHHNANLATALFPEQQAKLRQVVTHAAVNNAKLRQAEHEEAQRQKKQVI